MPPSILFFNKSRFRNFFPPHEPSFATLFFFGDDANFGWSPFGQPNYKHTLPSTPQKPLQVQMQSLKASPPDAFEWPYSIGDSTPSPSNPPFHYCKRLLQGCVFFTLGKPPPNLPNLLFIAIYYMYFVAVGRFLSHPSPFLLLLGHRGWVFFPPPTAIILWTMTLSALTCFTAMSRLLLISPSSLPAHMWYSDLFNNCLSLGPISRKRCSSSLVIFNGFPPFSLQNTLILLALFLPFPFQWKQWPPPLGGDRLRPFLLPFF